MRFELTTFTLAKACGGFITVYQCATCGKHPLPRARRGDNPEHPPPILFGCCRVDSLTAPANHKTAYDFRPRAGSPRTQPLQRLARSYQRLTSNANINTQIAVTSRIAPTTSCGNSAMSMRQSSCGPSIVRRVHRYWPCESPRRPLASHSFNPRSASAGQPVPPGDRQHSKLRAGCDRTQWSGDLECRRT